MRFIYTRTFAIFCVLLVAAALLTFFQTRGTLAPVEGTIAEAPRPVTFVLHGTIAAAENFGSYFGTAHRLSSQNAQLTAQVRMLQAQVAALSEDQLQNQVLKQELGYRQVTTLSLAPATVIATDPTGFTQTIVIDAGTSAGVKAGDSVLAQGVLIGLVASTTPLTSKVTLVTDPSSAIDVELAGSGQNGILKGSYGSGTIIDSVSPKATLTTGEQVVTADLNSSVPAKVLVGSVGDILSNRNDLLQRATVVSAVDVSSIQFVDVVK
jgi:rod shape-determining protein MreC